MTNSVATTTLRVMLVDDDPKRVAWVEKCLADLGFETCSNVGNSLHILKAISDQQPDVIIIDMESPGRDLLESLSIVATHHPTPIVMFSEEQNPDYIGKAVAAGVSTYLVGSIDPQKVRPIIEVAMAQFRAFQALRLALDETKSELTQRRTIDQAKHKLMKAYQLSEEQAYDQMRNQAMNGGVRIGEIADRILTTKIT